MQLLNKISMFMTLSLVVLILIIMAAAVIFVMVSRKKVSLSEVYYDNFERHDSMEYVKFDEIISSNPDEPLKGAGVMVVDHRTFVGIINVVGYNFFSASYDSQVNTINATISFFDSLESPISLRQSVKAIDITHNIEAHEIEARRLAEEITALSRRIQELMDDAEDYLDVNSELANEYMDQAQVLNVERERKNRQLGEAEEMIRYMNEISTLSGDTQKVQNIVFSYTYDGTQFTSALTKEEVYSEAFNQLENMANNLISGLYRCGCTARRCSAEEIVDLMRRHMHPATGDDYSIQELFNSNLGALFVTSDSMLQFVKERMTEDAYRKKIESMRMQIEEAQKVQALKAERAETERLMITENMVRPDIVIEEEKK